MNANDPAWSELKAVADRALEGDVARPGRAAISSDASWDSWYSTDGVVDADRGRLVGNASATPAGKLARTRSSSEATAETSAGADARSNDPAAPDHLFDAGRFVARRVPPVNVTRSGTTYPALVRLATDHDGETVPAVRDPSDHVALTSLAVDAVVQICVAEVTVVAAWQEAATPPAPSSGGLVYTGDCFVNLPMRPGAVVTSAEVRVGDRLITTELVPRSLAVRLAHQRDDALDQDPTLEEPAREQRRREFRRWAQFDPNAFRLRVPSVRPGDLVTTRITYHEQLQFYGGAYVLAVPARVPPPPPSPTAGDEMSNPLVRLTATINTGADDAQWDAPNHASCVQVDRPDGPVVTLSAEPDFSACNAHWIVAFRAWGAEASASAQFEDNPDGTQSVAVFVTPPASVLGGGERPSGAGVVASDASVDTGAKVAPRAAVFCIDISGSMRGAPLENAKAAVRFAIEGLTERDTFALVVFDHQYVSWPRKKTRLVPATARNTLAALRFVGGLEAGGGTTLLYPYIAALELLKDAAAGGAVPLLFLVTDGCVSNEREVCAYAAESTYGVRTMCFGIGPYTNAFFLRTLAHITRGFVEYALYTDTIRPQMENLLEMAAEPVMTDMGIRVGTAGTTVLLSHPSPVPDLYRGQPIVFTATLAGGTGGNGDDGAFGEHSLVTVEGTDAAGAAVILDDVSVTRRPKAGDTLLRGLFAQQLLNIMTAKAWYDGTEASEQAVVEASLAAGVPCAFTTMVAFETTDAAKARHTSRTDYPSLTTADKVLLLAGGVGGVMLLGVTAAQFGDTIATSLNSVAVCDGGFEGLVGYDLFGGGGGCECCGCQCDGCAGVDCTDCDCDGGGLDALCQC